MLKAAGALQNLTFCNALQKKPFAGHALWPAFRVL